MALLHFRLSSLLCIKSVTHYNYFLRLEHLTSNLTYTTQLLLLTIMKEMVINIKLNTAFVYMHALKRACKRSMDNESAKS